MSERDQRGRFVRMFGSAVVTQAMLSAASLLVGLILIRRTSEMQYGYYVLVGNAVALLTSLQKSFIQPAMVTRMTRLDIAGRRNLIGGLLREQRQLLPLVALLAVAVTVLLWAGERLAASTGILLLVAVAAVTAALYREFFRMVLLGYRRPVEVFRADAVYVVLLVAGAAAATLAPWQASAAVVALGVAAGIGGALLARSLWRYEAWNIAGARGILLEIAPLAIWSAAGSAIHWTFSQGYNYLVAGTLSVSAVAAIAGTRLIMMPINLLSTGIGTLMLPTTATWLLHHPPQRVFRRLLLSAGGLALLAVTYIVIMWLMRDWIFAHVLKKSFAQRDLLLQLWAVAFVLMACRDQLLYLLVARGRFRSLAALTLASALLSLTVSYLCMRHIGVVGALYGILAGESFNFAGITILSYRESRHGGPVQVT
ncbi:MAG: capsular biosynthesis protein [Gammaproteobacteria bacterium]|nr:capsular biosynthesis protein [Gammaproteobacteria bacterium]MDE2252094.1 capsular biosynthesis protein [Gammaproteobacteria bacterium]